MSTWEALAELALEIEDYTLEPLQANVSSDFERKSTVIHLRGAGEEGLGEDVTYDAVDHEILQAAGPTLPLSGRFTLASFCAHLAELELFPEPPQREVSSRYRTWAYESAALDLALRQAEPRCTRRSGAHRSRFASWSRCDSASRRRWSPSASAWTPTPRCASSSTRRAPGTSA